MWTGRSQLGRVLEGALLNLRRGCRSPGHALTGRPRLRWGGAQPGRAADGETLGCRRGSLNINQGGLGQNEGLTGRQ